MRLGWQGTDPLGSTRLHFLKPPVLGYQTQVPVLEIEQITYRDQPLAPGQ